MIRVALIFLLAGVVSQPAVSQVPAPVVEALRVVSPCEKKGEEIVVCGDRGRDQPYSLPPQPDRNFDPWGGIDSVSRERNKLLGTGPAGNGSCTVVGPGGWTGCDLLVIKQAAEQGRRIGIGTAKASVGLQVGRKKYGTGFR
jgi:hypothetical protein